MGLAELFDARTKSEVAKAVREIEAKTSAEVVVSVEPIAGHYRHADYIGGLLLAFGALCVFLYYPEPFEWTYLPIEIALTFAVGVAFVASIAPVRRALTSGKLRTKNVETRARASFVERGVSKTRARSGVLVYVAAFERRVMVVLDVGIDPKRLGTSWDEATQRLDRSLRLDGSVDAFLKALASLGPVLGAVYPRATDDENELPDAMVDGSESSEDSGPSSDEEPPSDEEPSSDEAPSSDEDGGAK